MPDAKAESPSLYTRARTGLSQGRNRAIIASSLDDPELL